LKGNGASVEQLLAHVFHRLTCLRNQQKVAGSLVAGVSIETSNWQPATGNHAFERPTRPLHHRSADLHHRPLQLQVRLLRTGNEGAIYADLPMSDYSRMVRLFRLAGHRKSPYHRGEPLLRHGVVEFVRELAQLRHAGWKKLDLAITTNGHLLAEMAQPLKDAGLTRVTVSMDAVDPQIRGITVSIMAMRIVWRAPGCESCGARSGKGQLRPAARLQ